jgi:hypothetical protein
MARIPRIERAGAWHHVTARGNERRAIYRDDRDRRHFCDLLGQAVELFQWRLHVYVFLLGVRFVEHNRGELYVGVVRGKRDRGG